MASSLTLFPNEGLTKDKNLVKRLKYMEAIQKKKWKNTISNSISVIRLPINSLNQGGSQKQIRRRGKKQKLGI